MSLYIDLKYVLRLSSQLEHFKQKKEYLWNCRCPLCGDSSASKTKARGYIYRDSRDTNRLAFKCHNCLQCILLGTLIKKLNPELYNEYKLERFRTTQQDPPPVRYQPCEIPKSTSLEGAKRCDRLPEGHPCILYLQSRLIPRRFYDQLYYTEDYADFIMHLFPTFTRPDALQPDARLVLPYFDREHNILATTGRSFTNTGIRYITIRADEQGGKLIYGLNRVNVNQRVYIVEGPIDSFFLPNAVASGDANLIGTVEKLAAKNFTLIFDNEKRNKEIIFQMEKAITLGYQVVIWPSSIVEKDLNQMILSGRSENEIQSIIDTNTFSGLTALANLMFWKRIPTKKGVLL